MLYGKDLYKRLCLLFPTREKRMRFLGLCVLTFGLRKETISGIFNYNEEEMVSELLKHNSMFYDTLKKVLNHGVKRQELAETEFLEYVYSLMNAKTKKEQQELFQRLNDNKFKEIVERNETGVGHLNKEDFIIVLKYQLKYMIGIRKLGKVYHLDEGKYASKVRDLEKEYPDLAEEYYALADLHRNIYRGR